jgi:hypothetical protein
MDEIQDLRIRPGISLARLADGPVDVAAILGSDAALIDVGAIHGEAGDHLLQCRAEPFLGVIARAPVPLGERVKFAGEAVQFARQDRVDDMGLAGVKNLVEVGRTVQESTIGPVEEPLAGRIDEEAVHEIDEFVAGRAGDRPILTKMLVPRQDLFDEHVEGLCARLRYARFIRFRCAFAGKLLELREVRRRIEQPVDMVQAQPLQFSLGDQPANQAMRLFEDCRLLHADTRQLIDVEEPAVIYLVGCNSPKGEPIVLLLQEAV